MLCDQIYEFLYNRLAYEQKLVSVINFDEKQILVESFGELNRFDKKTIKIEGMERFSKEIWDKCKHYALLYDHTGPVTCHAFLSTESSPSFPLHSDPDDVIIYCLNGIKTMLIDDDNFVIRCGEEVFIKSNTPHRAINTHSSIILSFGLENFLSEKIKKI